MEENPATIREDWGLDPLDRLETFETYRSYLFSIAYRMLGSVMDAEDMVQETYLRVQTAADPEVRSLKAYLTAILTRLCIDRLHRAYRQRETYLGPWLPEPILTGNAGTLKVEEAAVMQESLSLAFLYMLEKLPPLERAVFLLREVFDYDYADIARFVDRKEAACRQLFSRAKKHLAEDQHRYDVPRETHQRLLAGFVQAVQAGDQLALMDILAEDAHLVADGGGKIPGAATRIVNGRRAVAQFSIGATKRFQPPAAYEAEFCEINFQPAVIIRSAGRALLILAADLEGPRLKNVFILANPDKLAHL